MLRNMLVFSLERQGPDMAVERDTAERLARIDAEQLVTLRAWPGWPWKTLDPLAVDAATVGRLREAVWAADRLMADRVVGSSNSSVTIPPAHVPISEFSCYNNRSNVWYQRLWLELHRVLDRVPLGEWAGEE
jgi:hypothetical protein